MLPVTLVLWAYCAVVVVTVEASNITDYLLRYGYLSASDNNLQSEKEALMLYQEYYHLPNDGELNKETVALMSTPRCGVSDNIIEYRVLESWSKNVISWDIVPVGYLYIATKAFKMWGDYANLSFHRQRNGTPDIKIKFVDNAANNLHPNCSYEMEPSVIAHAFYPSKYNDPVEIHVSNSYKWGYAPPYHNLFNVLVHEIGHSLGLLHSDNKDSIMYAYYQEKNFSRLHEDDISAVRTLYGSATTTTTRKSITTTSTTTRTPTTSTTKSTVIEDLRGIDICDQPIGELKFLVVDTSLYIFHKDRIWIMDLQTKTFTSKNIHVNSMLKFLPKFREITAIYQRSNDQLVVVINEFIFIIEYPYFKLIAKYNISRFESFNKKIIGIVNNNRGQTFVFFEDNYYSELDECNFDLKGVSYTSKRFLGIPSTFDSVFRYTNGRQYFLQRNRYFQYNEFENSLERSDITTLDIFGIDCPSLPLYEQLKVILQKILKNKYFM